MQQLPHYQFITIKKLIRDTHRYDRAIVLNLVTLQLVIILWTSNEDSPMEVFHAMITPKTIIERFIIGLVILIFLLVLQRLFF